MVCQGNNLLLTLYVIDIYNFGENAIDIYWGKTHHSCEKLHFSTEHIWSDRDI